MASFLIVSSLIKPAPTIVISINDSVILLIYLKTKVVFVFIAKASVEFQENSLKKCYITIFYEKLIFLFGISQFQKASFLFKAATFFI